MSVLESIKSLGLIQVQNAKNTYENQYVQYLDYVILKPGIEFGTNPQTGIDKEQLIESGLLSDHLSDEQNESMFRITDEGVSSSTMRKMSLVLNKVIIDFQDHKIDFDANTDPDWAVIQHLLKKMVAKITQLAMINRNEIISTEKVSLDYSEKGDEAKGELSRKLISKCFFAANLIAIRGRRGPGDFVIAKKELIDLFSANMKSTSYIYPHRIDESSISGLKKFVCDDLGDFVIVGRCGNENEPGIRLISNDDSLEKNIFFNNTDIAGINIRYALDSFSESDKYNYVAFKFETIH